LLDIHLTDMQGWRVLERLKHNMETRHIPVCIVSTDEARGRAFASGAMAFIAKPIQSGDVLEGLLNGLTDFQRKERNTLLVVESDAEQREQILAAFPAEEFHLLQAGNKRDAKRLFRKHAPDCLVFGSAMTAVAAELLEAEESGSMLRTPVIVY